MHGKWQMDGEKERVNSSRQFNLGTYLSKYDVNYDGYIDLDDVNLALKMHLTAITPSNLQIMLGDTNNNNDIDLDM